MAVLTGLDILERGQFRALRGRKVGLITNHTGLSANGKSGIDLLHAAPDMDLRVLFSPEHGIRGALDEKVGDSTDPKTGLPIISLYGASTKPSQQQLKGLDALVFDIADIGCRFYTYSSTLGACLEEASKAGIEFFVLDRPNPITGAMHEGAIADRSKLSFVAWHPVCVRHGLTLGEIATLYNAERQFGGKLTVIKCERWRRKDWFDATGLTWVNPSPNMRSLTQATLYPGVGLLETTNVSVGRGTGTPFEVIGAPWIEERPLAEALNRLSLPGIRFIPVQFTPNASVYKDQLCRGVNLLVTNRDKFRPVRMGLSIAITLRKLYPSTWQVDRFDRLLVNGAVLDAIRAAAPLREFEPILQRDEKEFALRRRSCTLYR